MNNATPVKIRLTDQKQLVVTWSDGTLCSYGMALLRKKCPCAVCQAEISSKGPFYIPLYAGDALTLTKVEQLGHYALQLFWKDGHHTGIYDYEYLRRLCPEVPAENDSEQ